MKIIHGSDLEDQSFRIFYDEDESVIFFNFNMVLNFKREMLMQAIKYFKSILIHCNYFKHALIIPKENNSTAYYIYSAPFWRLGRGAVVSQTGPILQEIVSSKVYGENPGDHFGYSICVIDVHYKNSLKGYYTKLSFICNLKN